jgi:hypothetical protein
VLLLCSQAPNGAIIAGDDGISDLVLLLV